MNDRFFRVNIRRKFPLVKGVERGDIDRVYKNGNGYHAVMDALRENNGEYPIARMVEEDGFITFLFPRGISFHTEQTMLEEMFTDITDSVTPMNANGDIEVAG